MVADKITIYNFIAWMREQIEPDRLSALITAFGYSDDSDQTIMDAMQVYPGFVEDLGKLLGMSLAENETEINRSVDGVSFESNSLSLEDWNDIAKNGLDRATGDDGEEPEKTPFDWNNLVTGILGFAGTVWGGALGKETTTETSAPQNDPAASSSSSAVLWIVIGVVIIAIGAIAWVSFGAKK